MGSGSLGGEQFTDDIPLKAHAQSPPRNSETELLANQGHPYNEDVSFDPSARTKKASRKAKFFKKKIPWVTYLLTTIDLAVFIAELVRMGKSLFLFGISDSQLVY